MKCFEKINQVNFQNNKKSIFLFPYAGGGTSSFIKWKNYFEDISLYVAQFPGRENKLPQQALVSFEEILDFAFESIIEKISTCETYYMFGHSLGTKIVYELTLKIMASGLPRPKGIIISAGKAPIYKEENPISHLDDENFIKEINRFSGTPEALIKNIDVMKLFLPVLRADFLIDESYVRTSVEKIDVPILALMGTEDNELTLEQLLRWKEYTSESFEFEYIEGGHMFVNTNAESVVFNIKKFLEKYNVENI